MSSAAKSIALLVTLVVATSSWAQAPGSVEGSVSVVDRDAQVIVLEDGQAVRIGPNTVVIHQGQTITIVGLEPGMRVVVREGEPVTLREGRYVAGSSPSQSQMPPPAAVEVPAAAVRPATVVRPWCDGTYAPTLGTNFAPCAKR